MYVIWHEARKVVSLWTCPILGNGAFQEYRDYRNWINGLKFYIYFFSLVLLVESCHYRGGLERGSERERESVAREYFFLNETKNPQNTSFGSCLYSNRW